ncbi:Atxe2 family lasso peptide isopeptidase [Dyella sp. KULCS107]|uniref:Atxe2 family lasso peptide isopeptidase n=1 Tax=Dyella sp. KULCS107 TaxID=3422216 RepID=UPI003D6DE35C
MTFSRMTWRSAAYALVLACALVPASRAAPVSPRQLLEVVDIDQPSVSTDGRFVAFRVEQASVERNTYDTVWYVQGLHDAWPTRVADGGVPLRDTAGSSMPAVAKWSADDRWIYYLARIDGEVAVWRAAADGSGAKRVTYDAADVRDFSLVEGGRAVRYSVGATREAVRAAEWAEYHEGIHVDASVPIGQGLFRSGYVGGRLATQRFGKVWFDRMPLLGDTPDRWKELDLRTGQTRALDAGVGAVNDRASLDAKFPDAWDVSRSPSGDQVALLTRVGKRKGLRLRPDTILSAVSLDQAKPATQCSDPRCTGKTIWAIQWRPRSNEVLFTASARDAGLAQSIYRWNITSGAVIPVAESTGLLSGGRDAFSPCAVSSASVVCVSATANQPPRLERIDIATGARQLLFDPNASLAHAMEELGPVQLLRWKGERGKEFTGLFYAAKAPDGVRPPLFVDYYQCGGFVRGGVGDEWPFASLAAQGISSLCINTAPYAVDPEVRFNDGLSAVEGAVTLLAKRGDIDCHRVGMGGLSFGSEVTMWVAMRSKLLAAASISSVSMSPNYFLLGSLKGDSFTRGLKELWGLGSPKETPRQWRLLSPVYNLDKISAPILFQMPEQEYLQATDYIIPMIRSGVADLYVFPNEPHQKFQPSHKLAVYVRNVDWFRFWLQGREDVDPSKASQYQRWRSMREHVTRHRSPTSDCKAAAGG